MLLSQLFITAPQMTSVFWGWSLIAIPVIATLYCIGFLFKRAGLEKYYVVPKCAASFLCVGSAGLAVCHAGAQPWHHPLFWALAFCLLGDFFIEYKLIAGGISFGIGHCILIVYALCSSCLYAWHRAFLAACPFTRRPKRPTIHCGRPLVTPLR